MLKRSVLISNPSYIRVEVSPYCNLQCPGCLLGGANLTESNPEHRKEKIMSLALFKESVKDLIPYLIKVNLYDEGEPLLNKKIPKMITHLNKNKVGTCVSSNFSFKISDTYMKELLSSGLSHLIIAIDGATQESYSKYRKGGDLSLVLYNRERLIAMQKEIDNSLQIEIQFLEFPYNKNEREAVYNIAKKLGVWRFTIKENCNTNGWEGARFKGTEEERRKRGCYELWISSTINSTGEINCCDYGEDNGMPDLGMAKNYTSKRLRNHPSLVKLRRSFKYRSNSLDEICRHCSLYKNNG